MKGRFSPETTLHSEEHRVARPAESSAFRFPKLAFFIVAWVLVGGIASLQSHPPPFPPSRIDVARWFTGIGCYVPWMFLSAIVFRVESKYPLGPGRWTTSLPKLILWSIFLSTLSSPMTLACFLALRWLILPDTFQLPATHFRWFGFIPLGELLFWSSVAAAYFFRTTWQLQKEEQRAVQLDLEKSQLEASLNQAQIEVLRARLNPHFLFNSLQNISVLTQQDPGTASRMLTRLGDLLRAVLRNDSRAEHTIQEEIELTKKYADLEQMRFADRLKVDFVIADDTQHCLVPSFLLQPLVENAIVHGLRAVRGAGLIKIVTKRQEEELILSVTDNGIGLPQSWAKEPRLGVGIGTTRQRLERMFPQKHLFATECSEQGGTTVLIRIPFRTADAFEEQVEENSDALTHSR